MGFVIFSNNKNNKYNMTKKYNIRQKTIILVNYMLKCLCNETRAVSMLSL